MLVHIRVSLFPLLFCVFTVKSSIYLSNTNDHLNVEFYDCVRVHSSSLDYCRRPKDPQQLSRDNDTHSCYANGGKVHRFSELRSKNISIAAILHKWKSSVERLEEYSFYLRDSSSQSDESLCECLPRGSFGKNCEYQLPRGETFEETLQWQLVMRSAYRQKVDIYGDVICYETLECDSGLLCLDWREICDGIQNCLSGWDEENCDLLEMNQCDPEEEYRCVNGMCIPAEFFVDGEFDCLDWSDEMQYKKDWKCHWESVSSECDDHLCPLNWWSCGDGECIQDRQMFQLYKDYSSCESGRDHYFLCETHYNMRQWTMSNGRCVDVYLNDGSYEESSRVTNRSRDEECSYLIRCALVMGGRKDCPCGRNVNCVDRIREVCSSYSSLIRYPRGAMMGPFVFFLYDVARDWRKRWADFVLINGSVRCRDSLIVMNETIIPVIAHFILRDLINDQLCRRSQMDSSADRDQCYRGNESMLSCSRWNPCLSSTRIRDGSRDCVNGTDEDPKTEMEIDKSCASVRRHRLRCSEEEASCLPVMRLGISPYNCRNHFDQQWFGGDRRLSMNCHQTRRDECSPLRQYIEQSSSTSINKTEISSKYRIPFRWFCDSFWNLQSKEDEDPLQCQQWWICSEDQRRCQSGQCIEPSWFTDRQWDCRDAEDEHYWLNSTIQTAFPGASQHDFSNRSYFIPSSCSSQSHPFLCLSFNATRQGFECFNRSQIGDGHIDCAGGFDERMTLPHCSGQPFAMLEENFLCPSSNICIPFHLHCLTNHRCPNRSDDKYWCERENHQSSSPFDEETFLCFNGELLQSQRCDGTLECLFGEDEYACDYSYSYSWIRSREKKRFLLKVKSQIVRLNSFPRDSNFTPFNSNSLSTATLSPAINRSSSSLISPYWCNRGLGVLSTTRTNQSTVICFCPPQYYGHKCQFHQDRLSVVLQLNFTRSIYSRGKDSQILFQLVVVFVLNDEMLMRDQFHLHPSSESSRSKIHTNFVYPHSSSFREQRRRRFFNRTSLLLSNPFSIRIELYRTRRDEKSLLIALWRYPLSFDHLPVSRLAKVLHLRESFVNPCSSCPCHSNERCQPLMNNPSQFICLCPPNFGGENCSRTDRQCDRGYCAKGSLCQPNIFSSMREDSSSSLPFCLCRLNRVGHRCSIEHDGCLSSPCLHGGSCFPDSKPGRVICVCPREYFGSECQSRRPSIRLSVSLTSPEHRGAVIQYLRIDLVSLDVHLVDQQVFKTFPPLVEYFHSDPQTTLPEIVLTKLYSTDKDSIPADLYLLSVHLNISFLTGTTQISKINRCDHQRTLSNSNFDLLPNHSIFLLSRFFTYSISSHLYS